MNEENNSRQLTTAQTENGDVPHHFSKREDARGVTSFPQIVAGELDVLEHSYGSDRPSCSSPPMVVERLSVEEPPRNYVVWQRRFVVVDAGGLYMLQHKTPISQAIVPNLVFGQNITTSSNPWPVLFPRNCLEAFHPALPVPRWVNPKQHTDDRVFGFTLKRDREASGGREIYLRSRTTRGYTTWIRCLSTFMAAARVAAHEAARHDESLLSKQEGLNRGALIKWVSVAPEPCLATPSREVHEVADQRVVPELPQSAPAYTHSCSQSEHIRTLQRQLEEAQKRINQLAEENEALLSQLRDMADVAQASARSAARRGTSPQKLIQASVNIRPTPVEAAKPAAPGEVLCADNSYLPLDGEPQTAASQRAVPSSDRCSSMKEGSTVDSDQRTESQFEYMWDSPPPPPYPPPTSAIQR